jgi:hypothetical protein
MILMRLKKAQENMRMAGESMRKAFNNPDIKIQQEKMRQLGQQMRDYSGNPDMMKKERRPIATVQPPKCAPICRRLSLSRN